MPNDETKPLTEEEARKLIGDHIDNTRKWYWEETSLWESRSKWLQRAFLIVSTLTTIVAAFPVPAPTIGLEQYLKWGVVILSATATFISAMLTRGGTERTAQIRELGRVRMEAAYQRTLWRLTKKPMTVADQLARVESLFDQTESVELRYGVNPLVAGKHSPESDTGPERTP